MRGEKFEEIKKPTALLNKSQARMNIKTMATKAAQQNVRFRPHFKTHQSQEIGEWFREEGVSAITVSSVSMASYFAANGWHDILIAFPVNLRELSEICELGAKLKLSLLIESPEVIVALDKVLEHPVNVWIKVDTGLHRAGIYWDRPGEILALCEEVLKSQHLQLSGLLTHAGQTYHANSVAEILDLYSESTQHLDGLKDHLSKKLGTQLEISVGDTPGCWLSDDLGRVDEIRPGNFIFFDAMMMDLNVCQPEDVALIVACPVVAKHEDRKEVVIYGGSIHLSKEFLLRNGELVYGYPVQLDKNGWRFSGCDNYVLSLSQEHGVVHLSDELFNQIEIGGLLGIMPVHSCLVVDALGYMIDLDGNRLNTMQKR